MATSPSSRRIERLFHSSPSQDGDGVHIQRIHCFGGELDPFLMLDELGSDRPDDYIGGFPPHPHRGIQTLTYIVHGGITHEDHLGHSSTIQAGDAQWMHTGRGIVHSEMPLTDSQGLHGFQLWLNLPAQEKMSAARYRDVRSDEMPRLLKEKAELIALGGSWSTPEGESVSGPLDALAGNGGVAHARLEAGGQLALAAPSETLAVYVFEGALQIEGESVGAGQLARLSPGDSVFLASQAGAQCLLLAGTPHREPIAHYGPFVMNHSHEIEQALRDYRNGTFTD
ncbi:pirin family protein [Billgrantia desiderata]|uniref:Pirin family protein n=1 Tax=Billgrantia desiderata TaxID=52021 RepID=A0ABS9B9B7_9GAMM|nr:pirin family protein [Halomonas desiderata]MCE8011844.1 pirin family protein [Halomonas desiderata]MCE8044255.1 pirin family protein [Halomonas desiderata]MCE8048829.1 pirin family protein [Halomonas desiderata]